MLRKFFALLLILLVFVLPASADILWEPYDNDYYSEFVMVDRNYLEYMARTYVVPEGMTANLYESPKADKVIKTLEAGTRIYIGPYGELFGETWAAGYVYHDFDEGWLRLDRLQLEYDHEAFSEQFGSQFVTTDDKLTREDVDGEIQSWTYPGSGISSRTIPADALGGDYNDGVMTFQYVWTDPDGGRWGYVGYYMGRCGWVWLDDPTNPEPPVRTYPAESTVTDTSPEEDPGGSSIVWIAIPVAVLVLGTAIAIVLLKKKSKKS